MDLVNVPLTQPPASASYSAGSPAGGQSVVGSITGNVAVQPPASTGVQAYRGGGSDVFLPSGYTSTASAAPSHYWQQPAPVASPSLTSPSFTSPLGMEKVEVFIDRTTHQLYVPINVMDEVAHATPKQAETPFHKVKYTKTTESAEPDNPSVDITVEEPVERDNAKTTNEDAEPKASSDKNPEDSDTTPKKDAATPATTPPAKLTDEQQAVAEFMQAYNALKESISDPEVSAALGRMRNRMLSPWSINPFSFLKDLNTIRKDDSVKKFLKESKDLGPYWDKLKAALPEPTESTTTTTVRKTVAPPELVRHPSAPHVHPNPRPRPRPRYTPSSVEEKPTIIPVDSLSPELLAELMNS